MTQHLSTFILVLGALLFLVGLIFKFFHWPDMFFGIYSGPAFILFGLVLMLLKRQNDKSE